MSRSTITPHASHRMGIVEGERCCKVCFAAPWMAISEQECGASPTSQRDTEERNDAIERMYNDGRTIRDIARELRVSNETVSIIARERCVMRTAGNRPAITPAMSALALSRQAAGDLLDDIAADMGVGYSQLRQRLARIRAKRA